MSSQRSHCVRRIRKDIGPALFGYNMGESDDDRATHFKADIGFNDKRNLYERNATILCPAGEVNDFNTRFTNPQLMQVRAVVFGIHYLPSS